MDGTTAARNHANLIWGIAELLRGDYKRSEYGRVVLPLVVMRRLDQLLLPTRAAVLARDAELQAMVDIETVEPLLLRAAGQPFCNRSALAFATADEVRDVDGVTAITADTANVSTYLRSYLAGYSSLARTVFAGFDFERQIERLERAGLLYQVISRVCEVDLHPDRVSNLEMGYLFEELIRRFAEQSNETAGEHFTPREVVHTEVPRRHRPARADLGGRAARGLRAVDRAAGPMIASSNTFTLVQSQVAEAPSQVH